MADLTITAANVAAGENAYTETGTAGEAITAGQVLYLSSQTKKWMKADNNSVTPEARKAIALALNNAANSQPVAVMRAGDITIGAALTAGTSYFVSDTPGGICPLADINSGEYVCLLGIAKSASVLALDISFPNVAL